MKYLIFAALAFASVEASAQSGYQNVHEVALTTNTITQTINLCSNGGTVGGITDVTAATSSGTLVAAWALEVYNIAASTVTIVCGQDLNLSSATTSAWYGREVPAGIGVYYAVPPSTRKTYCVTKDPSGCTRVTVTQFK